jgi:hypothetical protein
LFLVFVGCFLGVGGSGERSGPLTAAFAEFAWAGEPNCVVGHGFWMDDDVIEEDGVLGNCIVMGGVSKSALALPPCSAMFCPQDEDWGLCFDISRGRHLVCKRFNIQLSGNWLLRFSEASSLWVLVTGDFLPLVAGRRCLFSTI